MSDNPCDDIIWRVNYYHLRQRQSSVVHLRFQAFIQTKQHSSIKEAGKGDISRRQHEKQNLQQDNLLGHRRRRRAITMFVGTVVQQGTTLKIKYSIFMIGFHFTYIILRTICLMNSRYQIFMKNSFFPVLLCPLRTARHIGAETTRFAKIIAYQLQRLRRRDYDDDRYKCGDDGGYTAAANSLLETFQLLRNCHGIGHRQNCSAISRPVDYRKIVSQLYQSIVTDHKLCSIFTLSWMRK